MTAALTSILPVRVRNIPATAVSAVAMAASFILGPQLARAQTTSEIKLSSSAAYDSNPFLGLDNNSEVASFRLELMPTIQHKDGTSDVRVTASIEHIQYTRRYDSVQNLGFQINGRSRINERIDVSAQLSLASRVSSTSNAALQSPIDPVDPQNPELPIVDDITLFGTQLRRTTATARTTTSYRLGEHDFLQMSSGVNIQRTDRDTGFGNSDFFTHSLAYSRQFNPQLSVGAMIEVNAGGFKYIQFGDSRTLSPQIVINARLNSRFNASGSFGASFTRIDLPGGQLNSTAFSGSGNLCYNDNMSSFCVNAQRQVLPTALGGIRTQASVGTSYSTRLSSRDTVQTGTSFSQASSPLLGGFEKFRSIRVFGRYDRQINEKMMLFGAMLLDDSAQRSSGRKPNYQAMLGISYRFGKVR
jgi:hypothetical protein